MLLEEILTSTKPDQAKSWEELHQRILEDPHRKRNHEILVEDIRERGVQNSILIDRESRTVAQGNNRVLAAREAGVLEIPQKEWSFSSNFTSSKSFMHEFTQITLYGKFLSKKEVSMQCVENLSFRIDDENWAEVEEVRGKKEKDRIFRIEIDFKKVPDTALEELAYASIEKSCHIKRTEISGVGVSQEFVLETI